MFFIFAIYQYVRLKKITKANTTAELEAEDEHRERKEHQSLHKSEELYRHTLKEELGTIRMLGSPEIQNLPVSLLDAFVSLDISETWRSESQYKPGKKFGMQRADRSFSPEAAIERAFKQYRMLLIIGEPGSGKTTLLKYYAMCCLSEHRYQKLGFKKPVFPIYFPLRELEPNDAYPSSLPENLVRWATRHGHDIAAETFYDWLHNRDTLVLLDGLDEISDLDQRKDENIAEEEWEKRQKHYAAQRAQAIIEFINGEKNKRLRELAAVPMLLQIMAIIWKERDHLPQSRSELYNAALKYLLDYRDGRRKLDPVLPADKALRVMAPVSLWMQEEINADEVAKPVLHEQMQPILKTIHDSLTSEEFCENLRDRAGSIADYGEDAYIFRHKSFREYLTGLQLKNDIHKPDRLKTLVRWFGNDWWEEPLIFFISEADDDMFDKFMDAFFRENISKELDQKSQNFLEQPVVGVSWYDARSYCLWLH